MLGKLIRTLKQRCPDCNHNLQLRVRDVENLVRGEIMITNEEVACCPVCQYDILLENEKKRKNRFDKTAYIPDKLERNNGRYKERGRTSNSNGKSGRRSN